MGAKKMSTQCKILLVLLSLWEFGLSHAHTHTHTETESQQRGVQEEKLTCLSTFFKNEWLAAKDKINFNKDKYP